MDIIDNMLKVIIFDADEVVILGKRRFSATLAEKHGVSLEETSPFFDGPFQKCLVGEQDLKKSLLPYIKKWGWSKGVDELLDYWFALENFVDKDLIKYIKQCRKKGFLCFLATNNEKYRFQYMLDVIGLKKVFDKTYASAHLGHMKPDQKFFAKIFKELKNIKKNEILFVDDTSVNVASAIDFGIHGEIYTTLANLKKRISILNKK